MTAYFISDLHLEESRPDITHAFVQFVDKIEIDASSLYILGDLFDSWIGDDENTPLQQKVKDRLRRFSDTGSELFFMHGNRDFLIGGQFSKQTGSTLLPDPTVININGEEILLMHGDSLCTADKGYMKFRETIRNPAFLEPFLKRSLAERKITAQQLRTMSQANNQSKSAEIMDVTESEVVNEMNRFSVELLIHGHTHRPKTHQVDINAGTGKRIVLGDWDKDVWYLKILPNGDKQLLNYALPPFGSGS